MAPSRLLYPVVRQPARVTSGTCCVRELARLRPDDAVIFMSSQPSVGRVVAESLAMQGADLDTWRVYRKPAGEPTRKMIDDGAAFLASAAPRIVIGIGGGSVLDWCRLAWAQMAGRLEADPGVPFEVAAPEFILVPTTCASGAEAGISAVYSDAGRKVTVVSDAFLASDVYLDSQFLSSLSDSGIACAIGDCTSHAIEAYCSVSSNGLGRHMAVMALRLALEYGPAVPSAWRRERLLEASYLAGIAASNCGAGVVQAFAHVLADSGYAHGLASAMGLRAGLAVNAAAPALRDLASRAGVDTVGTLSAQLNDILSSACSPADANQLLALLNDPERRTAVRDAMLREPSLRTNPLRLDEGAVDAFLSEVVQTWTTA